MFEMRRADCLVTLGAVFRVKAGKKCRERRPSHQSLALGQLAQGLFAIKIGLQVLDKRLAAEQYLTLKAFPGRGLADTGLNEVPVSTLGLPFPFTKLSQHPVGGEKGQRRLQPGGRPVAGPGIVLGILHQPSPYRIEDHIAAEFQEIVVAFNHDRLETALEDLATRSWWRLKR
jgi:hypothetical protein